MPGTLERSEMQRLARMGASARLHQLEQERTALLRAFPGLRAAAGAATPAREGAGQAKPKARRRRRFTAAERKAIAARMRKYWAEKRKKGAK